VGPNAEEINVDSIAKTAASDTRRAQTLEKHLKRLSLGIFYAKLTALFPTIK
jgi:hypothetical protein